MWLGHREVVCMYAQVHVSSRTRMLSKFEVKRIHLSSNGIGLTLGNSKLSYKKTKGMDGKTEPKLGTREAGIWRRFLFKFILENGVCG